MIPTTNTGATRTLRLAALVGAVCIAHQLSSAQSRSRNVTLDTGTVIAARLDQSLSSNESRQGDKFRATVKDDNSAYSLPSGSRIEGVVRTAKPKSGKNPGVLDLAFRSIKLPDGSSRSISGSLIGLDNKHVDRDKNGRLIAKKGHRTDRLTYVGYGAGGGLLVGLLSDKKNTIRDTAIGAGLGLLYGSLEKDKSKVDDVKLKEGTEVGVRLDSRLTLARSSSGSGRR